MSEGATHQTDRRRFLAGASALASAGGAVGFEARAARSDDSDLDATGLAMAVRAGNLSPLETLEAAIARLEAVNPDINCLSEALYERARSRARTLDRSLPFAGVPYLLKDETEWAGVRRHAGSRLDALMPVMEKTDTMISHMEAAGFVVFGRTTMCEFGALPTTETVAYGATRNPWNRDYTPGGSSGGAAAAVAAGVIPMADAWDGAGSIRIPASNCGLVGLKATRGRVPGQPDKWFPQLDLSNHFAVSRSVRDSANLLALTEVDAQASGLPPVGHVKGPAARRLKIGLVTKGLSGHAPSSEVADSLEASVRLLQDLGHQVVEVDWPLDTAAFQADFTRIFLGYAARTKAQLLKQSGMDEAELEKRVEPASLAMAGLGQMATETVLEPVFGRVGAYAQAYYAQFETIDLLLTPVLLTPPVKIGEIHASLPIMELADRLAHYADYTMIQNAVGGPAMSLPLHWTSAGLPVGVQFAANRGDERTLLELAFELEAAAPWAGRRPPVWAPDRIRRS